MRKILLTLILCLMLIAPAWGEEYKWDGYLWEQLGKPNKTFYMAGFLVGHDIGFVDGLFSANIKKDLVEELAVSPFGGEGRATSWYIREVDAFLQTYPLCKKQGLTPTLGLLTRIWFKMPNVKQLTYKEVGEGCSK